MYQKSPQYQEPRRHGMERISQKRYLTTYLLSMEKPRELNQFLSTIESYCTMYRICKTDLVMMRARGKEHEIIHHALPEEVDVEWSAIKRKLTSNYGSMRSGIEASVKISKLCMNSEETVGEYLARAKTLVKSKLKDATAWHHYIDEAYTYHICNRIIKTRLEIQDAQKTIPVQIIQGSIQQHRRRMGPKLLYGG